MEASGAVSQKPGGSTFKMQELRFQCYMGLVRVHEHELSPVCGR